MASVFKGLTELSLLITFVIFIYWINAQRPARTPFKPLRVRAWVPALAVAMLICWILAQLNFPAMIQRTPQDVTNAHIKAQKECLTHLTAERFLEASDAIRNRPSSHTLGPKGDYRGPILFGFLNPIINRILFGTGVAAASFPVLVWMAVIAVQRYLSRRATGATSYTPSKGEAAQWGVLLPVINNVTYLSAAVTLSFYFYVDPARSQKCVYSSGHWYTYTCTSLTFALVISHLWVYREQSVYAARLLAGYVLYTIIYQALAITVLKNTQMYYHSAPEAQDGILAAIPVFTCLMLGLLIIQYVTFLVTEHPQSRTNKRITVDEHVAEKPRRRSARIAASPKKGTRVDADMVSTSDEIPIPPSPSRTGPSANTRSAKKRRESESEATPSTLEVPTAPVFDEVPTAPSPPAAPAFTAPPPAPGAPGGSRDALLAQIEKGSHLKHVDKSSTPSKQPTKTSMDPHTALMKSIEERHHKLKKTEGGVQTGPKPPSDGLAGMLEKIRVVVQPEVDDEDDDGWEHVNKDE